MSAIDIGQRLASFLERGNSIIVATRNAALVPAVTRATAIRVIAPDRVTVLLPPSTSAQVLANLESNGEIAVCVSWPRDFRTYQLKGRCLSIGPSTPEDLVSSEQQLHGFAGAVAPFGNTRAQVRNLWLFDTVRAEVLVTSLFTQTPGPGAGARVERGDGD